MLETTRQRVGGLLAWIEGLRCKTQQHLARLWQRVGRRQLHGQEVSCRDIRVLKDLTTHESSI